MREVLTLPADKQVLRQISHLVDRYAGVVRLSKGELHDVQVAVAEVCTNAIIHGLHEDSTRTFKLAIEAIPDALVITVSENGTPFDYKKSPPSMLNRRCTNGSWEGSGSI